jgi:hypothetical protein
VQGAITERRRRHRTPSLSSTPTLNRERTTSSPAIMVDGSPEFDNTVETKISICQYFMLCSMLSILTKSAVVQVPYNRNPDFVGRQDVVERIMHKLPPDHSKDRQRVALHGFGGVGYVHPRPKVLVHWLTVTVKPNSRSSARTRSTNLILRLQYSGYRQTVSKLLTNLSAGSPQR